MRKRLGRIARRSRWMVSRADRVYAARLMPRLVGSGLVDVLWYSALSGEAFVSPVDAARHYLTVGRRQGLVPNPLMDPSRWMRGNWRSAVRDPLVSYLAHATTISPSVLFDPSVYLADHPHSRSHPGGPLGHFLSQSPAPPLPVTDEVLHPARPWEEIRSELVDLAVAWREFTHRSRPRRTNDFDSAAGARALVAALALPEPSSPDDRPLVSVVIPARDREAEIVRALKSVQSQTLRDWEVVVVDDGSTDSTPEVVERFAASDSRVRLIRREPRGVSSARNAGIHAARGHYIAFLDSDNRWAADFLRAMLGAMAAHEVRAAYCAIELDDGTDVWVRNFEGDLHDLKYQNHIDLNALVVERGLLDEIGAFDEGLRRMVDWDLVIRIAEATSIAHYPFVGVYYDDKPSTARITIRESRSWADAVVNKAEVDWESPAASPASRVPGRTSVVVAGQEPVTSAMRSVRSVLDAASGDDIEVVVVTAGPMDFFWIALIAVVGGDPRVRMLKLDPRVNRSVIRNLGAVSSSGDVIVFLDVGVAMPRGWNAALRAELSDSDVAGAQLLIDNEDGTVWCAGLVGDTSAPFPTRVQTDDVVNDAIDGRARVDIASAEALALRATTVVSVRGFDPVLGDCWDDVDLSLRAASGRSRAFVLLTDVRAVRDSDSAAAAISQGEGDDSSRVEFARRWDTDPHATINEVSTDV